MFNFKRGSKGFTLVELMVVVAILGVLMAIVTPAVTGTKSVSVSGQVMSDAKGVQTAVENFNNKSIRSRLADGSANFPEVALAAGSGHDYVDVYGATSTAGAAVLRNTDGTVEALNTPILIPGTTNTQRPKRTVLNFAASTDTYDASGAVKAVKLVPDFLSKEPSSIPLMGDETAAALKADKNTIEEYLWLLQVNAPGSDQESRTVQVYKLVEAVGCAYTTSIACTSLTYEQIY